MQFDAQYLEPWRGGMHIIHLWSAGLLLRELKDGTFHRVGMFEGRWISDYRTKFEFRGFQLLVGLYWPVMTDAVVRELLIV